jgi:hypothetical protein
MPATKRIIEAKDEVLGESAETIQAVFNLRPASLGEVDLIEVS